MSDLVPPSLEHAEHPLLRWTWSRGGQASVVAVDGLFITLQSTAAYPPGAPLSAEAESGHAFELKVRGCRRHRTRPDQFEIDGKLVNAARETREQLHAAVRSVA